MGTMFTTLHNLNGVHLAVIGPLDIIVVAFYMIGVLALGLYFTRKNKNTEEYFVAGRSYKGWVLGISMLSTTISSITFLAFPAAAFALDWRMVVNNLMWPVGMVLACVFFIPFFRKGLATTAFEYLENRFGPLVSLYGAFTFIILEILRMSVILYLVSLALSSLTGFPINSVIIVIGLAVGIITVLGGFEAVIWTDVVQAFILWGSGILCLILIITKLSGGLGEVFQVGLANGKFHLGDMRFDLASRTLWTMLMLGLWDSVSNFTTSQHVVQRYIAAKSLREARKGAILAGFLCVPTWLFFFFIGTAMWVFYHVNPDPKVSAMPADQVLSYFILNNFPVGCIGLAVAGIMSAAMGALQASVNGLSTVTCTNIIRKYFVKDKNDKYYVRLARICAASYGIIMILGSLFFRMLPNNESVVNLQYIMSSLFGGCVTSFFLLGFLTTKTNYIPSIIALAASIILNTFLLLNSLGLVPEWMHVRVHEYWVNMLVNLFFVILAYGFSALWKTREKNISGLTIWTADADSSGKDKSLKEHQTEYIKNIK
ncbi:MAG: sodium/solute symporter [Phycisphaerales bacterium]